MPSKRGPPKAKAQEKAKAKTTPKATPKANRKAKREPEGMPTIGITKFRFQYMDCKRMGELMPSSLYWDRVSVSVPCAEVWQKALQDPRFSRATEAQAASSSSSGSGAKPSRRLLTFPEMMQGRLDGRPLFDALAAFVYESVSAECRRQWAATQYWRGRVKSFALWLRGPNALEAGASQELDVDSSAIGEELPDPATMVKGSADPYYRCCPDPKQQEDEDRYNSLRQSQRVAPSKASFLFTLRMCYAEVSAPQGSLVLLRGQGRCRGQYVLAEYAERPEDELQSWRLAEFDEPLNGYRVQVEGASDEGKQTRRVAYPWRRRKVRIICEVPSEVLQRRGSGSVKKQGCSSKVLLEEDVKMLRAYAAGVASKGRGAGGQAAQQAAARKRPASSAAAPPAGVVVGEEQDAVAAKRRQDQKAALERRLAAATLAPARPAATVPLLLAPAARISFKTLYNLLERTHFPKGCRSSVSVTGFIPKNYLIFGLHRTRFSPVVELTPATCYAFGKLGDDAPVARRLRAPAQQYRELLEALQKHLLEVGMQQGRRGASRGILDPVSGQFIPEKRVCFTSVMVAKNKRTYFHKDGNNRGASYQVVVTDPDRVASGDYAGGNLLCWPGLSREEATRRTEEVHAFHDERREMRKGRREEQRRKRRELNPHNARWKGEKDEVKEAGEEEDLSATESDEDFVLHEKHVELTNVKLEEDIEEVEERGLDSTQVPTYEEDATVVECVNRYVSFVGRDVWHATQPWRAAMSSEKSTTTRRANRYCITFFAVDLKDEDGAVYKRELRDELVGMGFRPHASKLAEPGRGFSRSPTVATAKKATRATQAMKVIKMAKASKTMKRPSRGGR